MFDTSFYYIYYFLQALGFKVLGGSYTSKADSAFELQVTSWKSKDWIARSKSLYIIWTSHAFWGSLSVKISENITPNWAEMVYSDGARIGGANLDHDSVGRDLGEAFGDLGAARA